MSAQYTFETKIFDDISRQQHTDPVFLLTKGWGFDSRALYRFMATLGVDRVRAEIQETHRKTGIRNKGGYLWRRLENMKTETA